VPESASQERRNASLKTYLQSQSYSDGRQNDLKVQSSRFNRMARIPIGTCVAAHDNGSQSHMAWQVTVNSWQANELF